MENTFKSLGLNDALIEGLSKSDITKPTEIQERVIPIAMEKKDLIAQSKTGSGKTLAYLLPLFQMIDSSKREMQTIILAPTHELVIQIYKEVEKLSDRSGLKVTGAAIIGNVNIARQVEKLKEKPHIVVGSSARILELIKMKKLTAHTVKTIVIDEADRMLDKNNIDLVRSVIKTTLRERQLMLFSATITDATIQTAKEIMKEPILVRINEKDEVNPNIDHYYFVCEKRDKIEVLRKLIHSVNPERAIIFINKSDEIEIFASKLKYHKLNAEGIHGTNTKEDRKRVMEDFRNGKVQYLVASDIAARGLDIQGVDYVFNLDIPEDPKDYLHRAGRSGRVEERGTVLSIATENEIELIKKCENKYGINIKEKDIFMGKVVDPKKGRNTSPYKGKI